MIVGTDKAQYELVEGWGKLPAGWQYDQIAGVAIDSQDRVHIFQRHNEYPVIVFDRDGNFVRAWGAGLFSDPHGIAIGPDDAYYLVDRGTHVIQKYSPQGELLLTIGTKNQPAEKQSGEPFNRPAGVALAPSGDIFIADGYGNARIHRYTPDGRRLLSWGRPGTGPGEFNLPHAVTVDPRGRVLVADRENHRIQLFTPEGEFIALWTGFQQPSSLFIDASGRVCVAELAARVSILNLDGELLARWGGERSHAPGKFYGPHGICADAQGDIYVSEVLEGKRVQKFARRA